MDPSLTLEQFEALSRLDGCSLANAIEIFNVRLRNEGFAGQPTVRCMFPELLPMLGYAVTGRIRSATLPTASSLPPPQTPMRVRPGDLIHGDRNGVQTIPNHIAAQIPAAAACLEDKERKIIEFCKSGEFKLEELPAIVKHAEDVCSAVALNFTNWKQEKEE